MRDARDARRARHAIRTKVAGYAMLQGVAVDRAGALVAAQDESNGRRVLVRVLSPAISKDARAMRRLRHDLTALMLLRDPNVVAVLGYDEHAGALVYEWITGTTLHHVLRRGALETAAALVVLDDCLVALAALHRIGVLHRDVRPECVVIDRSGTASLRDAGVPVPPLRAGWRAGTPQYMAPELWENHDHTVLSDVYALSCVTVAALTGEPAFPSQDLITLRTAHTAGGALMGSLSEPIQQLMLRGLSADPEERLDPPALRSELAATAAATLGDGWRAAGRAALARASARELEDTAAPQREAETVLDTAVSEGSVAAAPWWRRRMAAVAAAAAVVLAAAALTALAVTSAPRQLPLTQAGSVSRATPPASASAPFAAASGTLTPAPSPSSSPSPTSVVVVTPSTARASLAPSSPSPSPSGGGGSPPAATASPCLLICPSPSPT